MQLQKEACYLAILQLAGAAVMPQMQNMQCIGSEPLISDSKCPVNDKSWKALVKLECPSWTEPHLFCLNLMYSTCKNQALEQTGTVAAWQSCVSICQPVLLLTEVSSGINTKEVCVALVQAGDRC